MKIIILLFLLASTLFASIPQQINYAGNLARPDGTALDTTVTMSFKLYTDSLAGTLLWTETSPSVAVANGLFNVRLGQIINLTDAILNQAQLWLGIQVGADAEMTPRTRMVSVPYAYRIGSVDGASGGAISDKINVGSGNTNTGNFASVFGQDNIASGANSFVGGGRYNRARGQLSTVAGGGGLVSADSNSALSLYSTISGGLGNTASNNAATIGGGYNNTASGNTSVIAGGSLNNAIGILSCIPGGTGNITLGDYSFAAGASAYANHTGSFVWGSSSTGDSTVSFGNNSFTARCEGGVRFYTDDDLNNVGVRVLAGGGSWASLSDSTTKRRLGIVNTKEILDKVAALPIERWSYKTQDEKIQHIGPMAQDFYNAFKVGDDETTITTVDPDGISLAAIQELAKENNKLQISNIKLEAENSKLQTQNSKIEERLSQLERIIEQMASWRGN